MTTTLATDCIDRRLNLSGKNISPCMRGLPECKEWSHEDFETGWVSVVETLVEEQNKRRKG